MMERGQAGESWWQRAMRPIRTGRARQEAAHALYVALVDQARRPELFLACAIPDSRDGRLEAIYLHAILVFRRLHAEGPQGRALAQALFDVVFGDVDRHLREWGVGDLSVGKQVKKLVSTFYGRVAALEPHLAGDDPKPLAPVLRRNVYAERPEVAEEAVLRLAAYLLDQARWLGTRPGADLLEGRVTFARTELEAISAAESRR